MYMTDTAWLTINGTVLTQCSPQASGCVTIRTNKKENSMNNRNAETTGIPVNILTHKQYLQCKQCGKRFVVINGCIQEDSLEENPFKEPAESVNFFDRFKKLVMCCPKCGSRGIELWSAL